MEKKTLSQVPRDLLTVHASEEEDINPLFTELISDAEGKAWSVLGSLADGLREYYQRQLWIQGFISADDF